MTMTHKLYLTRVAYFNAAHKLYCKDWTDEQNKAVFGKCANPNFHGHNYKLLVTVKGKPQKDTGFICNAKILGDIIEDVIIEQFDHRNLNLDSLHFTSCLPTVENITLVIWQELSKAFKAYEHFYLHKVQLYETENIFAEYYGE